MALFVRFALLALALIAVLPLDVVGQTFSVASRIDTIGGTISNQIVSSLALNTSDVIVTLAARIDTFTSVRSFWYRNTRNGDLKSFTTSLVATKNLTFMESYYLVVKQEKNNDYVVQVFLNPLVTAQFISLSNPSLVIPSITVALDQYAFDRYMDVLVHSDGAFSLVFGAIVATSTCVYHTRFTVSTNGTTPQQLFCGSSTSSSTNLEAWIDPTDSSIFYIVAANTSNSFYTYKCINALQPGSVSCTSISLATLSTQISISTGRRALNSNAFFYLGTSDGNDIQVIVVDFVAGVSSIVKVPLATTSRRNVALVDSTIPNAVTLVAFDTTIPGIRVFDILWNSTSKQVWYAAVANLTKGNNFDLTASDIIPASSNGPSIFSISSVEVSSSRISTQFYGRLYCGDGLVFTAVTVPEQCDSVQYCDTTTCQCPNGSPGTNVCNAPPPPGTPIAPPVAAPVSPPVDVPVAPVAPPMDVPVSTPTPVSAPIDAPVTVPNASPVSSPATSPVTAQDPVPITTPAEAGNSTDNISDGPVSSAGASITTIVPAVVVPVAVASAGVAVLVVLLQRRKKKKQAEKTSASSSDEASEPQSERVKLEPVNYFAVPTPSPELGKDSNTSAGSMGSNASLVSTGSNTTIHNPLGEPLSDTMSALNTTNRSRTTDDRMDIPYSELKFIKEIGAGAFGKVFLGEWQKTRVAMKISSISSSDEFIREAELLINLRPHPNVVQILGISADGVNVVMIMEFCDGGSLDSLVFKKNPPMSEKIHLLSGIAKGIYHLHKNKIVHRDLAARNVLLSRGEPKISDFGMSRKLQEATAHGTTKATVGPIRWMAPECLRTAKYSTKSDVWSFGILCWEVLSGEEPHLNSDPLTIGVAIRDQGVTPTMNTEWDPALQSLMKDCWKVDPEQRPEFDEICERLSRFDE